MLGPIHKYIGFCGPNKANLRYLSKLFFNKISENYIKNYCLNIKMLAGGSNNWGGSTIGDSP